jgi:glutathione S-transferase
MLKIHGHPNSINVRKVLWLCAELDLPCEREDWGGYGQFRSLDEPAFRALNPVGMIPVIEDGETVIWESNTILRYLAAKMRRTDLLPVELAARARIESWMDWQVSDFNGSWRACFQGLVRHNPDYRPEDIAASLQQFNAMVGLVETQLAKTAGHIAGAAFTLADIPVGLSIHRWYSVPMTQRPHYPQVAAYYDRLNTRPGYRAHGRNGTP